MAEFVARDAIYPTVGELVNFIAVRGELVDTGGSDPVYNRLKLHVREQKGLDLNHLSVILDELEHRFVEIIAPPGIGEIVFQAFRRFLDRYQSLVLTGRVIAWGRDEFVEQELVPRFIVPHVAWLLGCLNQKPLDFLNLDELVRADSPLKVAFDFFLSISKSPKTPLAELYQGTAQTYAGKVPDQDVEDRRKVVRRWMTGESTPSMETCMQLLSGMGLAEFSGIVFWVWLARLLQKVDRRHRLLIAEALREPTALPDPTVLGRCLNDLNDALARQGMSSEAVKASRILTTLLFYNTHRHQGDKARVEEWLAVVKELTGDWRPAKYYVTWLEARYHLFCRDMKTSLLLYERALHEGMYADFQAERDILPEWAAVAQKAGDRSALKRIDSRMKFLRMYPKDKTPQEIASMRLRHFHEKLGAGLCFLESFAVT
jgi:hypothetical protein